jgi:hypothetical protein
LKDFGRDGLGSRKSNRAPLRTAADSSANVKLSRQPGSSREHEGFKRRERNVDGVNLRLQADNILGPNARLSRADVFRLGAQDGTQIEQLVLHAAEARAQRRKAWFPFRRFLGRAPSLPHERIELIHRSVAPDAITVLGHNLAACQPRLTGISLSRVDPIQVELRLVERILLSGHAPRVANSSPFVTASAGFLSHTISETINSFCFRSLWRSILGILRDRRVKFHSTGIIMHSAFVASW